MNQVVTHDTNNDAVNLAEIHYFFDSAFPTGSFGHSAGFESFIVRDENRTLSTATQWIKKYLLFSMWYGEAENLSRIVDLVSNARSIDWSNLQFITQIQNLDLALHSSRTTVEARQAQLTLCQALIRTTSQFFSADKYGLAGLSLTEPSTVIGAIAGLRGWNVETVRILYLVKEAVSLSSVLVRYAIIGQSRQLVIVNELLSVATTLGRQRPDTTRKVGTRISIENELDQMRHPFIRPRLFQS